MADSKSETGWTPGPWTTRVIPAALGLKRTGYVHQVTIGGMDYTVAHHSHQNYDHIHKEDIGGGYARSIGIGRREPDLTPHPDARLIAAAPDLYSTLERAIEHLKFHNEAVANECRAALRVAREGRS